jgi:hypothetical protein
MGQLCERSGKSEPADGKAREGSPLSVVAGEAAPGRTLGHSDGGGWGYDGW